ncbi:hypothetical protein MICAK_1030005 [Microcystis aeruginosa PCC 9701]|uniref:Uncharacterized protein n=1 Tax=Microcystis aeruginosa PCC 9701 TaxID=721123 RepID=I4IKD0_MICAE|nr:hypothetical protein MICAK_1030005 [Microcystis aeruginosa PCC 9701]
MFRNWATVADTPVTAGVKLTPARAEKSIVTVGIVFSLNDMFELEEFDSPPDHYIPRKKMQPHSLDLSPQIIANVRYFTFGQVFINFA